MSYKFLGTGGALDYQYGNASMIVDLPTRVLVDCGPSVFPKLMDNSLLNTFEYLLLTHLHGDHVGSIFQVLHARNKIGLVPLKILAANQKFAGELKAFLNSVGAAPHLYELIPLKTLPEIEAIDTTDKHMVGFTSFAYLFRLADQTIYYSGDLGDVAVTQAILKNENSENMTIFHDTCFEKNPAHVFYKDLEPLSQQCQVFGYHLNPQQAPADNSIALVQNQTQLLI